MKLSNVVIWMFSTTSTGAINSPSKFNYPIKEKQILTSRFSHNKKPTSKEMATESSEGEEETKLIGGNTQLVVDTDLREMAKKVAWSVSSCKSGNGVSSLRDDNYETYWQWCTTTPC